MVCGSCKYDRGELDPTQLTKMGDLELKLDTPISRVYTPITQSDFNAYGSSLESNNYSLERSPKDIY
jgi:hypothetical protein